MNRDRKSARHLSEFPGAFALMVALGVTPSVSCQKEPQNTAASVSEVRSPEPSFVKRQTATVKVRMDAHFSQAEALLDACIVGQPEHAQSEARWLSEDSWSPHLKESWKPHVSNMQQAAQRYRAAPDLHTAALALAELGRSCGDCHRAFDAPMPALAEDSVAPGEPMQRHAWAVEQMWWALLFQSDGAWTKGAQTLAAEPTVRADRPETDALVERLQALGAQAQSSPGAERVQMFSKLLTTCAACHGQTGAASRGQDSQP